MNKTILLVTLEFPPCRAAGVQRPFRFAQYLQEMGWNPIILTASPDIYESFDYELAVPQPLQDKIFRSKAWNTAHSLSINGKFPSVVTVPDRYWPWYFTATRKGQALIKEFKPALIWSSYPFMTSHLVARKLALTNNLPWIADFRDPIQCHYNPNYHHFNSLIRFMERRVIHAATKVCTVTEEAADLYRRIYPEQAANKFSVIENGFVPFDTIPNVPNDKFVLLYSGALYGDIRDVSGLFRALGQLKQQGLVNTNNFVLRFRGSGPAEPHQAALQAADVQDLVEFCPAVPFEQSIAEMQSSSANLLIQDTVFQYQIPGKLYDYIQTRQPLLAICPAGSATANRCQSIPNCLRVWSDSEIYLALQQLITAPALPKLTNDETATFSRKARTGQLIHLMEQILTTGRHR
jgi:hypothetical protein